MKKLVLAMACVLSLGLLASCKNGTQDVNLKNQAATEGYAFYGDVAGTFVCQKTTGSGDSLAYTAEDATVHATLAPSSNWAFSSLSWSTSTDKVDTNYTTYTLIIKFAHNTGATNAVSTADTKTFTIYKIGDKYYTDSFTTSPSSTKKAEVKFTEGTPEDSKFTIESLGIISTENNSSEKYSATGITFTRAE